MTWSQKVVGWAVGVGGSLGIFLVAIQRDRHNDSSSCNQQEGTCDEQEQSGVRAGGTVDAQANLDHRIVG